MSIFSTFTDVLNFLNLKTFSRRPMSSFVYAIDEFCTYDLSARSNLVSWTKVKSLLGDPVYIHM